MPAWDTPVRLSFLAPSPCLSESWASKTAGMLVGQASSGWSRIFYFKSWEERKEMMKAAVCTSAPSSKNHPLNFREETSVWILSMMGWRNREKSYK